MTEQELKEYSWEICDRLSHLKTVLGRLEFHEQVDKTCAELLELKLSKHECLDVLATVLKDYDIEFEPHLVPAFEDIHGYVSRYLFADLVEGYSVKAEIKLGFGRRPE